MRPLHRPHKGAINGALVNVRTKFNGALANTRTKLNETYAPLPARR